MDLSPLQNQKPFKMNKIEEHKALELVALDFIAAMIYQTDLNVQCMRNKVMKLPNNMPLKNVVILFVENQQNWLSKLMRGLKQIGMYDAMKRDLNSNEVQYYSIVCEFARQTHDIEAAANIMEALSRVEEIPESVQEQIFELLNNIKP